MSIAEAIILAVIEGITEFLPISSTGHLILAAKLLDIPQTDFVKSFEIVIQPAAILAIIVLYWRTIVLNATVVKKIITAFIPTGIIGFFIYKLIKSYLIGNEIVVVYSLIVGGSILILFEKFFKTEEKISAIEDISYRDAFIIGVAQAVSVIPGVSRAAATILGGLALGISRKTIVEFSFLLAVPTMLAASTLDVAKNFRSFTTEQVGVMALGCAVSFLVSIFAVKLFLKYIEKHNFVFFGIYRICAAILFLFVLL